MTHHVTSITPDVLPPDFVGALHQMLDGRVSQNRSDIDHHAHGESYHAPFPPQAVCRAASTDDVVQIVKLCSQYCVPIVPFGAGTSLEGHVGATHGGISLDLAGMNRIVAVRADDLDATVEAGVTRQQLNTYLRDMGLFFPVDPGAECTLGGMAATRASGTNAVRYGTMRDNVIALTVVMADGSVIRTGARARKSSSGYDLTRLLVGSEGTLGVITEITLRLYGIPEAVAAALCCFPDVGAAVATVTAVIQSGIPVARAELLDANTVRAINRYSRTDLAEAPTVFFEFHGSPGSVAEQSAQVEDYASEFGATRIEKGSGAEDQKRLWHARHNAHYAIQAMRPGARVWSTDVCVPYSALVDLVLWADQEAARASFFIAMVGHVGDGNFHMGLAIDPTDPAEMAEAEALNDRLVRKAIALEGTCTGEHGIGTGKRKFMALEHGNAVPVMRAIKQALDPLAILNPGKVLPDLET